MENFKEERRKIPHPEEPREVEEFTVPFGIRFPELINAIVRKVGSRRSLLKRINRDRDQIDSSTEK